MEVDRIGLCGQLPDEELSDDFWQGVEARLQALQSADPGGCWLCAVETLAEDD